MAEEIGGAATSSPMAMALIPASAG